MNNVTTPGEDARRASTPESLIPEWVELEVMNVIKQKIRLNPLDNTYVIDELNELASLLIEKYNLVEFYDKKKI